MDFRIGVQCARINLCRSECSRSKPFAALGSAFLPRHAAYIDGEDPNRSSWGRFVNHCSEFSKSGVVGTGCNLEPRIDGARKLVWFEAKRDIAPGEEICFDYGASYRWDTPGTKGGPVRDENRWR